MPARLFLLAATLGAAILTTVGAVRAARPVAPVCPPHAAALSAAMPADVCIPEGFTDIAVGPFDDYSWRAFVALTWPADARHRGAPAANKPVTATGPRVFETYKPLWEIFRPNGTPPAASFDAADTGAQDLCGTALRVGDLMIASYSGIDDIGQAGIGVLDPPVAAQNGRYIRTLTLYNQPAFDFIVTNRYFLRSALPAIPTPRPDRPVMEFPTGSIALKTAWVDMAGFAPALVRRIYTRSAVVKNPTGGGCAKRTMGLVGMHIAQKTASRPQWIWSTFEQNDLVPPAWPDSPGTFVLNDGQHYSMSAVSPLSLEHLAPEPVRTVNVVRDAGAPILTRTELANFAYKHLLAGTPWQHYRLVMTQWPRVEGNQADPISPTLDGSIGNTFPGLGAFSAFANVTMETFSQQGPQLGCMSCHNRARLSADFMWSVFDHAYPSRLEPAPLRRSSAP
ncbi:MAG: hypothetical protein ABI051_13920 [Vicinamibacterales bacterium]